MDPSISSIRSNNEGNPSTFYEQGLQEKVNNPVGQEPSPEIQYPEFGQAIGNPYAVSYKQIAAKVALVGIATLAVIGIGVACGALMIGIATAGSLLLALAIYKIGKKIFVQFNHHRYRLSFDLTDANRHLDAPKLGHYSKVDLRVSNHATESFEWKKALISSAKQSIELSANFAGGKDFRDVLQLIEKRMIECPALKCHLIISSDLLEQQDRDYLNLLKEVYPNLNYLITDRIYTTTPNYSSEENHVKMLVVDGQYFAMGGTGIHEKMTREEYLNTTTTKEPLGAGLIDKAFRDTDIMGYGDAAQTMRNQFFNLYRIWEYRMTGKENDRFFNTQPENVGRCELFHEEEGLIKNSSLKYVVAGPEHRQENPISTEIASLVNEAQQEVKIANLLFNPDTIINNALINAKAQGIEIEGYFNGTSKNSSSAHYIYALPNRYNYQLVTRAFEYRKQDQLYHKKVLTVDSRYTMVGSFNLGIKSTKCDYENVCVIDDPRVTQLIHQSLKEDASASKRLENSVLDVKRKWSTLPSLVVINVLGTFFG